MKIERGNALFARLLLVLMWKAAVVNTHVGMQQETKQQRGARPMYQSADITG